MGGVLKGQLLCLVMLSLLFSVFVFIEQLQDVGTYSYGTLDAIWYVITTTPYRSIEVAPFAALFGILLSVGTLVRHSEIVSVLAAGEGLAYIMLSILAGSIPLIAMMMIFSQWVAPELNQDAELRKERQTSSLGLLKDEGFWIRRKNEILKFNIVEVGGLPHKVVLYRLAGDGTLSQQIQAASAEFTEDGPWRLKQGTEQRLGQDKTESSEFDERYWQPFVSNIEDELYKLPISTLSLGQLWAKYRDTPNRGAQHHQAHLLFWQRACLPLTIIGMVLLAATFVLTTPQRGQLGRVVLGCMGIGVFCMLLAKIFAGFGLLWNTAPILSGVLPGIALLALSVIRYLLVYKNSIFPY